MPVWWVLWGIGVLNVVALAVSIAVLSIRERRGKKGMELLTPFLGALAVVTGTVGGSSGVVLILISGAGAILIAGTVLQLVFPAFIAVLLLTGWWLNHRDSRIAKRRLPREKVLELIETGLVHSFVRRDGVLDVTIDPRSDEGRQLRQRRADPKDYLVFVAAADELLAEGRMIHYHDETGEGPSSTNHRWITVDEAAALLGTGQVATFSYGARSDPGDGRTAFRGTPTGIGLFDHGWVRYMAIAPEREAALVPLARAAHASHGSPKLRVDGRFER
ncbi:hypothetical protein [Amycolatopsis sp. Hca4]|uniref:hypothetical protein n=1 Tax=Amycolatopsis sp. Hca4 TaxID=2742131 RepID=UPI00158FB262|nr:hypothetical protein [Amycolatopsis sp. Hca4]QKV72703.1 hypothetical protein HUT10_01735 [Amycolatopsis sp. Hca4]